VFLIGEVEKNGTCAQYLGTHHSPLPKPIHAELDIRSDFRSDINTKARRVHILDGFIVHCEIIMSILSTDGGTR
jgi:hypothetical protein